MKYWGILMLIFVACQSAPKEEKPTQKPSLTILISKAHPKKNYQKWLEAHGNQLNIHHLYELSHAQVDSLLPLADGILISGGEDVEPSKYGKGEEIERCGKINLKRDSLELKMIRYAMDHQVPLLGICRGEQILNVANGGSLIIDIPTDVGEQVKHRGADKEKAYHPIDLVVNTTIYKIAQGKTDTVRSSHHQAVERLAEGFRVAAYSPDSVIEAIEWADSVTHPFLMGVQWHPEKMGYQNVLSGCFAKAFLEAATIKSKP